MIGYAPFLGQVQLAPPYGLGQDPAITIIRVHDQDGKSIGGVSIRYTTEGFEPTITTSVQGQDIMIAGGGDAYRTIEVLDVPWEYRLVSNPVITVPAESNVEIQLEYSLVLTEPSEAPVQEQEPEPIMPAPVQRPTPTYQVPIDKPVVKQVPSTPVPAAIPTLAWVTGALAVTGVVGWLVFKR